MEKLGIEPIQLFTQTINFILMVVILGKFLYKPILKILEERRKKIAQGLAEGEKIKLELEKTEKKKADILAKARVEAKSIVEEGKTAGKRLEAEIISKAHLEADSIIAKSKEDIRRERQDLEQKLKSETVVIAEEMVRRLLSGVLTPEYQKKIIDKKLSLIAKKRE